MFTLPIHTLPMVENRPSRLADLRSIECQLDIEPQRQMKHTSSLDDGRHDLN